MKYTKAIISLVVILSCCKTAEELTLERMNYTGNELRIDGYYYHQLNDVIHSFVLFNNGTYLSLGYNDNLGSLFDLDEIIKNENIIADLKEKQWFWGVFKVSNNNILIDRWLPGNGGPYPVELLEGDILNDETIMITGFRQTDVEDEFKFRHLSPKPDSTNMFIP